MRVYDFEYDGQGRICKAVYSDEESSDETIIEYNETGIIATNNSNGHKDVCTLNSKGQIVNSVCTSYGNAYVSQYIYDENGYLTTIYLGEDEKDGARFTWENGNLVKVEGYGGSITFNYNADIPFSKGSILFFSEFIDLDCDILNTLFNCGYMGKVPQNMPASMTTTNEYYSNLTEFSYEMGKDGYISKINVKENGNSVYSMTLTWE